MEFYYKFSGTIQSTYIIESNRSIINNNIYIYIYKRMIILINSDNFIFIYLKNSKKIFKSNLILQN